MSIPAANAEVRPGRRAVSEWALVQLQELILSGQLAAGDPLGEVELTKMLGVSRSPTSAALRQLEDSGLVDVSPTSGRRTVKRFGLEDLEELYTIRLALEPLGARMAAERVSSSQLRELSRILAGSESIDTTTAEGRVARISADYRFHAHVCEASRIARLSQLLKDPWLQTRALLAQFESAGKWPDSGIEPDGPASHSSILEHIRAHEPEAAETALAEHLRAVRKLLLEATT
ncbi:MAG: GntR family transcriptional regulator [Candidatus Limnocylindrales bacterium]